MEVDVKALAGALGGPCWVKRANGRWAKKRIVGVTHKGALLVRDWDNDHDKAAWVGKEAVPREVSLEERKYHGGMLEAYNDGFDDGCRHAMGWQLPLPCTTLGQPLDVGDTVMTPMSDKPLTIAYFKWYGDRWRVVCMDKLFLTFSTEEVTLVEPAGSGE